ncbi:MAG: exosortase family protein XrtG [Erysipelotrichaceae bacterium]|nr:exosortase family protein XrtG [Erysipelotrichaceae bacterium]
MFILLFIAVWQYSLHVFKRSELYFWRFLFGAMGMFGLIVVVLFPVLTEPLSRSVAALAGIFGRMTDWCTTYFRYGIIFIEAKRDTLSLMIDMECSGIIEISVFVSLITFFDVYRTYEKVIVAIIGFLTIELANAFRIILIASITHFFGMSSYYVAHTFIGRIFFYFCSIVLYFYIFTKPQIIRMKVGNIVYGNHKPNA